MAWEPSACEGGSCYTALDAPLDAVVAVRSVELLAKALSRGYGAPYPKPAEASLERRRMAAAIIASVIGAGPWFAGPVETEVRRKVVVAPW